MAHVVPFPVLTLTPVSCGYVHVVPYHVWPEGAHQGDPCVCGSSRLTIDPRLISEHCYAKGQPRHLPASL